MLGLIDDRYELTGHLSRSEHERLYRAEDRIGQTQVLVRELSPKFFPDSESLEFFLREYAQFLHGDHHGLVAPVSVRQAEDGRIFLIGEYVAGISLRRLLDFLAAEGETCSPATALSIGAQIGAALVTAHNFVDGQTGERLPALHLDVCPSNILLTTEGTAKLKGLEIARARIRQGADQRPGRLSYLSPERILGAYLDQRTDLYSLGVVVFETLTNETPFAGDTATALKNEILSGSREYPAFDQRQYPQGLRSLVQKSLALNPDSRYAGLKPFLAELSTVAAHIKGSGGQDELSRIVKYAVHAVAPTAQPDRIEGPGEVITTILLDRPASDTMSSVVETKPAPAARPKPVPAEPIEALASGALFADPVPASPERPKPVRRSTRPQKRLSGRVIIGMLAGLAVVLLMLDFAIGVTPLGRLFDANDEPTPTGAQIASVPPGASIFINDQYSGRTPRKIKEWPTGVTSVRLEYRGFPVIETVIVIDNNQSPELPVFLFSRTVSIRSQPPGAEIMINGLVVSPARAVGYPLRASDTLNIAVSKEGFSAPTALSLTCDGPIGEFDEDQWLLEEDQSDRSLTITGVFLREIMIASRPPGAEIFVNADTTATGTTNLSVILPFGMQQITLRHPSFLDRTFEIEVTEDSPDRYSPALGRYLRISAVDPLLGPEDIGARIEWVRLGNQLIKGPDDRLQTPYSLSLQAANHEIKLVCDGYEDTTVVIGAVSDNVTIALRAKKSAKAAIQEEKPPPVGELKEFKWVKFKVKRDGDPVLAATVIGYEEKSGVQYEFGTTGEKGELLVKVPPGKFNFVAVADGERSKASNKKIKAGKKTQSITLKFR